MVNPDEVVGKQKWFQCDISPQELKTFMKRDNYHAVLNFGLWLLLLAGTGYSAFLLWGTWWCLPVFFLYGVLYSSCNARWHECSHGTPFKANWLNEFFYFFCGAMEMRDPVDFRWSHARHHSYTLVSKVDPEIPARRPPSVLAIFLDCFYLKSGGVALKNLILHSLGIPGKEVKPYVDPSDYRRMFWWARAALSLHLVVIAWAIAIQSILPLLFFGLPRYYGAFFEFVFIFLQHAGMEEDVADHRLVCRSLKVNPLLSFLYMNMESHIEHHLYPLVPYHALPRLRKRLAAQMPPPYRGLWEAIVELLPVLRQQFEDYKASVHRPLPAAPLGGL